MDLFIKSFALCSRCQFEKEEKKKEKNIAPKKCAKTEASWMMNIEDQHIS
jgi:hypothetical protein